MISVASASICRSLSENHGSEGGVVRDDGSGFIWLIKLSSLLAASINPTCEPTVRITTSWEIR
jgi:hypothetical protein